MDLGAPFIWDRDGSAHEHDFTNGGVVSPLRALADALFLYRKNFLVLVCCALADGFFNTASFGLLTFFTEAGTHLVFVAAAKNPDYKATLNDFMQPINSFRSIYIVYSVLLVVHHFVWFLSLCTLVLWIPYGVFTMYLVPVMVHSRLVGVDELSLFSLLRSCYNLVVNKGFCSHVWGFIVILFISLLPVAGLAVLYGFILGSGFVTVAYLDVWTEIAYFLLVFLLLPVKFLLRFLFFFVEPILAGTISLMFMQAYGGPLDDLRSYEVVRFGSDADVVPPANA